MCSLTGRSVRPGDCGTDHRPQPRVVERQFDDKDAMCASLFRRSPDWSRPHGWLLALPREYAPNLVLENSSHQRKCELDHRHARAQRQPGASDNGTRRIVAAYPYEGTRGGWKNNHRRPCAIATCGHSHFRSTAAEVKFTDFPFLVVCEAGGIQQAYYLSRIGKDGVAVYATRAGQSGTVTLGGKVQQVGGDIQSSCKGKTLEQLRSAGQAYYLQRLISGTITT